MPEFQGVPSSSSGSEVPDGLEERFDSYHHNFEDNWEYIEDESFAARAADSLGVDLKRFLPEKPTILCVRCRALKWDSGTLEIKDSRAGLREKKAEAGCELCAMMLRAVEKTPGMEKAEFDRFQSGLRLNRNNSLPTLTIRRISVHNAKEEGSPDSSQLGIWIGLPKLPMGGSTHHFAIIKAWLDDCDENQPHCRPTRKVSAPTRLIDVGTLELPSLRLVESSSFSQSEEKFPKYVALSHPWGASSLNDHFVTDSRNVEAHRTRIPSDSLSSTLADAIKAARHLKIPYIWIDSLCIIQGEGGDFEQEADRMESVFSSAYCVIAATRAKGSSSGFLDRQSRRELREVKHFQR